ncbi:MAG: Fe/S biogenesis protein NfuA [Deltaproteobacteria bacterium]|jgi:Fe/S biogenesis protein NfuA|nr:Fe/S biogenesis protein NfuA [Deltaproteobacteria bacterium]
MFKFTDISDKDNEFDPQEHLLSPKKFFELRRTTKKVFVFDLRSAEEFEKSHLPGAHNLPYQHFEDSIYQMPFTGDIMLYGDNQTESFSAAEILYDNGFDTFYFIESYESLLAGVDDSFVQISTEAENYILEQLDSSSGKTQGIEIIVDSKTDRKANYSIQFVDYSDTASEKILIDLKKFIVFVSKEGVPYIEGTEIEINEDGELTAFNPNMSITKLSGSVEEQIQHVLDEEVNPMVASHGGVVSLLEVKDNNAYLEFGGGCQGCGMIDVTLKQGVEVMIREQVPEIEAIYDITDHAEGDNPYYQPSAK